MLIADETLQLRALSADDIPALQMFYDANPEYSLMTSGRAPLPDEAHEDFHARPPADWPQGRKWMIGIFDDGSLIGVADVIANLFATHIWHVGYFMVATARYGDGTAPSAYALLERWMQSQGATWLRLGVVVGNARAERFWSRVGYVEVRQRSGIEMGVRVNVIRVMVRALSDETLATYLEKVARDRPEN